LREMGLLIWTFTGDVWEVVLLRKRGGGDKRLTSKLKKRIYFQGGVELEKSRARKKKGGPYSEG